MPQEKVYADFSGGMNASLAVDKLQDNELLVADNVRLDETGNASIIGASTHLNTAAYTDGGTSSISSRAHSLYINDSIGVVAGVGADVFTGQMVSNLSDTLTGQNPTGSKMSFTASPNRIFFDVGGVPYFVGGAVIKPTTVDWAPPSQVQPTPSGPFNVAASGTTTYLSGSPHWTNAAGVVGTSSGTASCQFVSTSAAYSDYVRAINPAPSLSAGTIQGIQITAKANVTSSITAGSVRFEAILEIGGVPVGSTRSVFVTPNQGAATITFGGVADLWATNPTVAQVNASNFGVRINALNGVGSGAVVNCFVQKVQFSIYQESGSATVAGTGTTGTLTGTYTYVVTNVSDQGEETDPSLPSNTVVVSGQQVALSGIPVGDARTVSRNIYRAGGALTTYYLITTISDNVTSAYNDNLTDISVLSEGVILPGATPGDLPNTRMGSTTTAKFPCFHLDRVFWANLQQGNQNELFWSKPLNAFAYPDTNSISVGDSKAITGIVSLFGMLIIFKTDSIWTLQGTDESSFNLQPTLSPVGTDQPFTIQPNATTIQFWNARGPWIFNGYTSVPATNKLDPWIRQEDRTNISLFSTAGFHPVEVVNTSVTGNFCGVVTPKEYYFAYAESGQTANNSILVFDVATGRITKRAKAVYSLFVNPLNGHVYAGDGQGFFERIDDWNASVDASLGSVTMELQTKYYDLDSRGSNLAINGLEFNIQTNGQTVTPTVYFDNGESSETLAPITVTTKGPKIVNRSLSSSASRLCKNISIRLTSIATAVNVNANPTVVFTHVKILYDVRSGRARTGQLS